MDQAFLAMQASLFSYLLRLSKLSLQNEKSLSACAKAFDHQVIRIGLEPMTYCLEGSCSIQLSYRTGIVHNHPCSGD